ncbi:MAG: GyrI-like domain-containing protein [Chloroflexota bacterium]
MVTDPKIAPRPEQPYASIRTLVTMDEFGSVIQPLHSEVMQWLKQQGIAPTGAPFIRYNVIDMAAKLDVEMGWPTEKLLTGTDRITTDVLPAGNYAALLYTGHYDGLYDANRVLIEWGRDNHIEWDGSTSPKGDVFAGRVENYITDPGEEPDSSKWETEVAIKVADKK